MKRKIMKKINAPQSLKQFFDNLFNKYCSLLPKGVLVKMFVPDNSKNRALMREFQNYLQQRAAYECWQYQPKNFQVVYSSQINPLNNEVWLANPYEENVGWEKSMRGSDIFVRLKPEHADRIRTLLELLD